MILELLLAQAMSTGQLRVQMSLVTNITAPRITSPRGVAQVDSEGLLFRGVGVAKIPIGDEISETHCSSLLEKAGIETAGRGSPYRPSFESSGPGLLVVSEADLVRARKVLSDFAKEGYISLIGGQQSAVAVGYKSVMLSQLSTADFTVASDRVLARCVSSFVDEVMPRRPLNVLNLAIRQRKYYASAKDPKLSVGYEVLVVVREAAVSDSLVYHTQSLASGRLTPWQRIN